LEIFTNEETAYEQQCYYLYQVGAEVSRHFGTDGAEVSGHFGTSADMSYGQFGTGGEVSWVRSVYSIYATNLIFCETMSFTEYDNT